MLRCAPLVSPPLVSPRRNSRAPSLFRRCAPYKSSHPDQSVADLTRPRRFLMKSSLTRSVAPLICQTGIMQTRLRAILFSAFAQSKLANMYTIACVPPAQNHPKIFFSEVQAVLHSALKIHRCRTRFALFLSGIPLRGNVNRSFAPRFSAPLQNYRSFTHFRSRDCRLSFERQTAVPLALSGVRRR